eukprot:gene36742-43828_t
MPQWNQRYKGFRELIAAAGKNGKFVAYSKKPFVPAILFLFVSLFFVFIVTPYFAAVSRPLRNLKNIDIYVADFDGGKVGVGLVQFLQQYHNNNLYAPNFKVLSYPPDVTMTDLRNRVLDGYGWGAVYAMPGASENLVLALEDGCASAANYSAASAITLIWDEGRNAPVADANVGGLIKGLLSVFSTYYSAKLLNQLDPNT